MANHNIYFKYLYKIKISRSHSNIHIAIDIAPELTTVPYSSTERERDINPGGRNKTIWITLLVQT